jgi:hypothetical protein
MSAKKRILFIANEMSPYLELTEFAETDNKLAIKANENGTKLSGCQASMSPLTTMICRCR